MSDKERYIELIFRYLSREIEESELALLTEWIKSDPKNKKIFEEYKKTYELSGQRVSNEVSAIEIDKEWELISSRIKFASFEDYGTKTTKRKTYMLYAAAAILLMLLMIGGGIIYFNQEQVTTLTAQQNVLKTNLSDGSQISLNVGSVVRYSEDFNTDSREITLSGEAFFKVAKNSQKPFRIHVGDITVEVVGTQFTVDQSKTGVFVAVTEGLVKVFDSRNPENSILLKADENCLFNADIPQQNAQKGNNPNIISWETGQLLFNNTELSQVVDDLEHAYGIKILLKNPDLGKRVVTVSFSGESPEAVLNVITSALGLKVYKVGDVYQIEGSDN